MYRAGPVNDMIIYSVLLRGFYCFVYRIGRVDRMRVLASCVLCVHT